MSTVFQELSCREVVGGFEKTGAGFRLPGIEIWVDCEPADGGMEGGDIHFAAT